MNLYSTPLPEEGLLHLRGKAISEFLQGQLTCDMRKLSAHRGVIGAFCNPKGRVISDVYVVEIDKTHCAIRLKQEVAQEVSSQLGRYAQFSRIAVEVAPENAVSGIYAPALVEPSSSASLSQEADSISVADGGVLSCRTPGSWDYFAVDPNDDSAGTFAAFSKGLAITTQAGSAEHWYAELLRSGLFAIGAADMEKFTPQALNYDRLNMVSFDKGCYTGQEVVARLHYKGKSKTRMQSYIIAASDAGTSIDETTAEVRDPATSAVAGAIRRKHQDVSGNLIVAASIADSFTGMKLELASSGAVLTPSSDSTAD